MRLRSSSIRAKIIALLLVPIVALVGLWAYATLVTASDFRNQLNVASTYRAFGSPVDQLVADLQNERRAAVIRLAGPGTPGAQNDYQLAQAATDRDVQALQSRLNGADADRLNATEKARLRDVLAAAGQLTAVRGEVGQSLLAWEYALGRYSDLIRPAFTFRTALTSEQSGQLPRRGMILTELARARDYLSQEDAAMEALQTDATPTAAQYQAVLDPMRDQQALFSVYVTELDQPDQGEYLGLQAGPDWATLGLSERVFQSAGDPATAARNISATAWRQNAARVLGDLATINARLADNLGAQADSSAMGLLWRGAVAGVIGLLAIVLSVVISYRIGRELVRELIGLRNAAHELAGTRLPSVMRRLRRGEPVDLAAEAPDLDFGPAEIGQVGRAFSAVQRTAVRAAVEQAELRRGVSAVFVNLARRSQVLLHRQLTLLDTMERRTEDPAELEDLFKLDHLTTRMRRHAEGLIILSGGSPGRAWRKPVRMVDVVRAAVGEVEDYARVIVRPFPGTGLLGSAVADVTHLIAELVENAAVFSPPQTQVTVQGEVVAHGFALEIDDRGLGLSEQALVEINQRLEVEQEFDLADTDRLGLFVVSRLARRHGIRVSLRASPYGGTSAVVLIPRELLAEVPGGGSGAPVPRPAEVAPPRQRELVAVPGGAAQDQPRRVEVRGRGHQRVVTGPQPAGSEPARTPGGLPRRRTAGGPTLVPASGGPDLLSASGGGGRHRRPEAEGGDAGPLLVDPGAPAAGALLPRRIRQASLAPQLKAAAAARAAGEPDEQPVRERSPEEARAAFSSFQRGFSRGRSEPDRLAALGPVPPVSPVPPAPPPFQGARRALASAPVPPALPAAPRLAPPAPAEGHDR